MPNVINLCSDEEHLSGPEDISRLVNSSKCVKPDFSKGAQNSEPLLTSVPDMTVKPEIEISNKILDPSASTAKTDADLILQSTTLDDAKQSERKKSKTEPQLQSNCFDGPPLLNEQKCKTEPEFQGKQENEAVIFNSDMSSVKEDNVLTPVQNSSTSNLPRPKETSQTDPIVVKLREDLSLVEQEIAQFKAFLEEAEERRNGFSQQLKVRLQVLRREADNAFNWLAHFPWHNELHHQLAHVFQINSFRPLQQEALNATLLKRDVFAILPTGAGKSLIYQLAAVVDAGLTVVIAPLISLSQDQQAELHRLGIRAEALDSTTPKSVVSRIYADILPVNGRVPGSSDPRKKTLGKSRKALKRAQRRKNAASKKEGWVRDDMNTAILFVTPEQVVRSKRLMSRLESMHETGHLSRICIDEAHCCSFWGHDFRADYRKLGILRRQCPDTPILALSATCSPDTTEDVCKILEIDNSVTFRGSIDRPNLFYEVRRKKDSDDEVIADIASWLDSEFQEQCGIVYVLSKKEAENFAMKLQEVGVSAACYHGDMERDERAQTHTLWSDGQLRVVVATIAFGLGINNHHTRFVIHATMATSIEGYYQESGRCGRDGRRGRCIVLQRAKDFTRLSSFVADKGSERVQKFYEIYRYSSGRETNSSKSFLCRRAMIAASFGEVPPKREADDDGRAENSPRDCCDLCRTRCDGLPRQLVRVNVTSLAKAAVRIMIDMNAKRPNEKVTMLALATNWSSNGVKAKQMRGKEGPIDRRISIDTRLEIIIQLVFVGGLEEYFRHSSYSINGYVAIGEKSDFYVYNDQAEVYVIVNRSAAWELKVYGGCSIEDGLQIDEDSLPPARPERSRRSKTAPKQEEDMEMEHTESNNFDKDEEISEEQIGEASEKVEDVVHYGNDRNRRKRKIFVEEDDEEDNDKSNDEEDDSQPERKMVETEMISKVTVVERGSDGGYIEEQILDGG